MAEPAPLTQTEQSGRSRAEAASLGWAPLLTGSALAASGLALGLARRSWWSAGVGVGLATGGGLMIYRGVSADSIATSRTSASRSYSIPGRSVEPHSPLTRSGGQRWARR